MRGLISKNVLQTIDPIEGGETGFKSGGIQQAKPADGKSPA
ncbi:hypothetical protein [Bradyrhizobium neotropicale]|nr:hypothetical protein [Bradyrhizobium neotropicale]